MGGQLFEIMHSRLQYVTLYLDLLFFHLPKRSQIYSVQILNAQALVGYFPVWFRGILLVEQSRDRESFFNPFEIQDVAPLSRCAGTDLSGII